MKGNEIVQALRCCAKGLGHDDACENCKVGEIQNRREYIEFAAANVIERLTAESAELRKEIEWKDMVISLAQREQAKVLDAADLIGRLTAENAALREKVPQWISVEERLPIDRLKMYLVAFRDTFGPIVDMASYFPSDGWTCDNWVVPQKSITHWMPLPGAPEEGGEADA